MENDLMKRDNSFCGNFNFRKFCCYRCCYLFIYKDRTDSWYAHAHAQRTQTNHTPCNDFNDFTATHGLMAVEMFCFVLFFALSSVRFAFVCALRAILKLKISTNTHTIRIKYHNKYFTKRKCFLPTSPFIGRIIFGILINCFKNDGWSSNVINASSSMFSPEYSSRGTVFLFVCKRGWIDREKERVKSTEKEREVMYLI